MSSVSLARSGYRNVLDPTDTAASTNALAVIDLEPGSRTEALTGRLAVGAAQAAVGGAESLVGCVGTAASGT
jgi:hypothetical protein